MAPPPPFDAAEYDSRLAALRATMSSQGLELSLLSTPENIFYLTGLDHWGYFAPHLLIVPLEGEMVLVTRAMERVTVAHQVANAWFEGHSDEETAADVALRVLRDRRSARGRIETAASVAVEEISERIDEGGRIGIEKWSSGLPYGLAETLISAHPAALWHDITGLVDTLRMVKSPAEQACMREAARISDAAAAAAINAVGVGVAEHEIAAECHRAMIVEGGTFPGFGPFIRSTARLGEEHTSWSEAKLSTGDALFIEMSGCLRRYHAPLGRLIHVGCAPAGTVEMAAICRDAFEAVLGALRPGVLARDVYAAWQKVVDRAGMEHYRRHHCGYLVGIGFPPSWTGGNRVTGLRADSDLELKEGMTFHILSWLMGTGRGDFFLSNTVLLGSGGPEVLTKSSTDVTLR